MKITNQIWKLATIGMILACICLTGVINVFAIVTPWIDISQLTTEEETNEETQAPEEEITTTPSQEETTENNDSEDVTGDPQPVAPSDTEAETVEEQTDADKTLFGGCKSAFSVQAEGCVLLLGCVGAMALAMKKRASHNA